MSDLTFADGVPIRRVADYAAVLTRVAGAVLAEDAARVCCWEDLVTVVGPCALNLWHAAAASEVGSVFGPDDQRRRSAENLAAENLFTRALTGIRTHCVNGDDTTVPVQAMLSRSPTGVWLTLMAGSVTGCESAPFEVLSRDMADPDWLGWTACAGTPGRYDRLVVTAESLRSVYADTNPERPTGLLYRLA